MASGGAEPRGAARALARARNIAHAALASPIARLLGGVACVVLFALLLLHLRNLWRENPIDLDDASVPLVVLAVVVTAASAVLMLVPWADDLRAVGQEPPRGLLCASLVGQLAKYIPGGIWPFLGRMGLANRLGVPIRVGAVSLGMESVLVLATAAMLIPLALAGSALPLWVALLLVASIAAGVAALTRSGRMMTAARRTLARASGRDAASMRLRPARRALVIYVAGWVITGFAFWLTAAALYGTPVSELPLYAGAFAIAWAVGYVIVFAPGGLGVREVVLVVLLRPSIGEAEALLLAAASRIAFTLSDLLTAAAALPVVRLRLRDARRGRGVA